MATDGVESGFNEQASNIWNMLENMAQSDPKAYGEFMQEQMKEAKKYMTFKKATPEPHMCVKTRITGPKPAVLYINICSWVRVTAPKSDDDPIPIFSGDLRTLDDCKVITVAFNPEVLDEHGRDAKREDEQQALILLAVDFIQDMNSITVSPEYQILPKETIFYGDMDYTIDSIMGKVDKGKNEDDLTNTMGKLQKDFKPVAGLNCESLISQINSGSVESDDVTPTINLPNQNQPTGKKLIEEIADEPLEPTYSLEYLKGSTKNEERRVLVRVELPGIKSVKDCQLDISTTDLSLEVVDKYKLAIKFPEKVCDEQVSAKFSKKTSTLTVTLPVEEK